MSADDKYTDNTSSGCSSARSLATDSDCSDEVIEPVKASGVISNFSALADCSPNQESQLKRSVSDPTEPLDRDDKIAACCELLNLSHAQFFSLSQGLRNETVDLVVQMREKKEIENKLQEHIKLIQQEVS